MKSKYIHIGALFLASFFCDYTVGQVSHKDIFFDHYGTPQGFPGSQALCIEKAKDGFLWIGSEQGLIRFDGHTFKTYRANPLVDATISSNYIRDIQEDRHGRLWVTALPDLNVFDPKTGRSKKVIIPFHISEGKKLDILCFKYDELNDIMWIGTNKGLLYSQGKHIYLEKSPTANIENIDHFTAIEIDKDGIFWLAGKDGIVRYDPFNCGSTIFHRPSCDLKIDGSDGFISSYLDQENNVLWYGNWVFGLMKFEIETFKMTEYTFANITKVQNGVLDINKSGTAGEKDLLWLATTDGTKTFDTNLKKFADYKTSDYNDIKGVPGASFCLEPTKSEGMWIGSFKGLHRYDAFKQNVQYLDMPLSSGLKNWALSDICFENNSKRDSIIWFGIPYNSIFRYDLVTRKLALIPSGLKEYCDKVDPNTLYIDSKNILWLSSNAKGFVGYDLTTQKLIFPIFNKAKNEKISILKVEEDTEKNLWFGTTSGIFYFNRNRNDISSIPEIKQFLDKHKLSQFTPRFMIDERNKLWIIVIDKFDKSNSLINFDPQSKKIALFLQKDYPALSILKVLEDIKSIGSNKLILTSFNGFAIVNTDSQVLNFDLYESYNDKPFGGLQNACLDHTSQVWMSTDNGVIKFDPESKSVFNFSIYNSLIGLNPSPDLAYSSKTNTLYIGQDQGLNSIRVDSLMTPNAGEVILSDVKIVDYRFDSIPVSGQTIMLNYDQNSINFEFTNLSFTNSQSNTYQYTLGEGDDAWINMSDNTLTFNNLGYGNYTLRVRGENSFGIKSHSKYILFIEILPPFWRSWWFNLLILGSVSFGIYRLFRYRELQRQKLEKLRHTLARDLHDDMGSTLSHIRMMSEREAMKIGDNQVFKIIADKTAEVMSNMTEIIWSINPINDSLSNIIGKIQEFAIDTLEPLGINVFFDIEKVPDHIKLNADDRRHLFLIFKEAINNAAKYSKATQVTFTCKYDNHKKMMISLDDNGHGFDPMIIKRGNGLKNMKSRALALKATIIIKTDEEGTSISLCM